jgi:hypothetical protein
VDDNGNLLGFAIAMKGDDLRQEACPFTGEYFKYVKSKIEEDDVRCAARVEDMCISCGSCCAKELDDLSPQEEENGWEVAEQGDYIVKVKTFMEDTRYVACPQHV